MSLNSSAEKLLQTTTAKLALAASFLMPAATKAIAQADGPAPAPTYATQPVDAGTTARYETVQYGPPPYYYGSPVPAYGYPVEGAFIQPVCPTVSLFARLGPIGIYGSPLGYDCYWPSYPGYIVEFDRYNRGFFHRGHLEGFREYEGHSNYVHSFDAHRGGYAPNFRPQPQPGFYGGAPAVQQHYNNAQPQQHYNVAPPQQSHTNVGPRPAPAAASHSGGGHPR